MKLMADGCLSDTKTLKDGIWVNTCIHRELKEKEFNLLGRLAKCSCGKVEASDASSQTYWRLLPYLKVELDKEYDSWYCGHGQTSWD